MERKITLVAFMMATIFSIGLTSIPFAFAQISLTPGENVLSIEPNDNFIHKINPNTGATIDSVEITLDGTFPSGLTVNGGTGIAHNPADGKTYALLKLSDDVDAGGGLDRHLATINLQTGVASLVGNTDVRKIASLTFDSGTLYSVDLFSGDLSTISTADGSVTNLCELDFFDGTGLTFNPDDGFLYYTTTGEFQRIDDTSVDPCDVTDIALSDFPSNPRALTFFNSFLIIDFPDELSSIDNNDDVTLITNNMDDDSRGLTVIFVDVAIGGTFIPIDQSALLLAGVSSVSMWMIPVILAGIGIGVFVIKRRK